MGMRRMGCTLRWSARQMMVAVLSLLAASVLPGGFLSAQGVPNPVPHDVHRIASRFSTGCLDPSPCNCAEVEVGQVGGSFRLESIPGSLGPIFEYQILDLDMLYYLGPSPVPTVEFTGSGQLLVDAANGTLEVSLELSFEGAPPLTFETNGAIPQNSEFPHVMTFDVFHQVDSCLFEGIKIRARARGRFVRGDTNEDGVLDLADALRSIQLIVPPGPAGPPVPPKCRLSIDSNGDNATNIADPIYLLNWLFLSGPPPGNPFPDCGPSSDPVPNNVACEDDPNCV